MSETKDCVCDKCVAACRRTPGWFAPGEAEKAAGFMGLPFEEFKEKYIIEDYWIDDDCDVDVLAPRKVGIEENRRRASWGYGLTRGTCVFLKDDRCSIHPVKPFECKAALLCGGDNESLREQVVDQWRQHIWKIVKS